jgi:hypothetical protein
LETTVIGGDSDPLLWRRLLVVGSLDWGWAMLPQLFFPISDSPAARTTFARITETYLRKEAGASQGATVRELWEDASAMTASAFSVLAGEYDTRRLIQWATHFVGDRVDAIRHWWAYQIVCVRCFRRSAATAPCQISPADLERGLKLLTLHYLDPLRRLEATMNAANISTDDTQMLRWSGFRLGGDPSEPGYDLLGELREIGRLVFFERFWIVAEQQLCRDTIGQIYKQAVRFATTEAGYCNEEVFSRPQALPRYFDQHDLSQYG